MTMRLSEAEEVKAGELGLTLPEMRSAKSMRISAETYARHKREIAAEKAADDDMMSDFTDAVTNSLPHANNE